MPLALDKYRSLYFGEAQQQLDLIQQHLRELEASPSERAPVDAAFRAAHTLKAMSATMGYQDLTRSAHALEDLLVRVRDDDEPPSALNIRLIVQSSDDVAQRLRRAEANALIAAADAALLETTDPAPRAPFTPLAANVRVRQQDLNRLLELVGQIAVSSNHLERAVHEPPRPDVDPYLRIHRELLRELKRLTWQLNMSPVGPAFDRYARVLQELASQQNKQVRVTTSGGDVELCHAVLDELHEPMLHLLRNAMTHGMELPVERTYAGKDAAGAIALSAERSGDRVRVKVADDGRGLDAGALLQAAYTQGLINREQRSTMTTADAYRLIMQPNFSMARTVTTQAGRGIGMSMVKQRLEAVGGRVEIESTLTKGTTFILEVPRLVGLIEVELVRLGRRVYGIATREVLAARVWSVSELTHRLEEKDGSQKSLRVIDAEHLKQLHKAQLNSPAGHCLVELHQPVGIALRVDELLGTALLNYPFVVQPASIPLLDPVTLLADSLEARIRR